MRLLETLREWLLPFAPLLITAIRLPEEARVIPASVQPSEPAPPRSVEEIAFDKAEEAERSEKEMQRLHTQIEQLESAMKDASAEDKERIQSTLEASRRRLQALEASKDTNP